MQNIVNHRLSPHNIAFNFTSLIYTPYSEDYYGDLDLKAIRKSELLAGTSPISGAQAPAKAIVKSNRPAPKEN